jgi:hypothetical protein
MKIGNADKRRKAPRISKCRAAAELASLCPVSSELLTSFIDYNSRVAAPPDTLRLPPAKFSIKNFRRSAVLTEALEAQYLSWLDKVIARAFCLPAKAGSVASTAPPAGVDAPTQAQMTGAQRIAGAPELLTTIPERRLPARSA